MKQLSIIFICLIFSCKAKEKSEDRAKMILGKWTLTTNEQHGWVVSPDSISYFNRTDRSTYKLFGDSVKIMSNHFKSEDNYDLKFKGNDTLTLNGTDGEHIYVRVK